MDVADVRTSGDFFRYVRALSKSLRAEQYDKSLEDYLSALWGIVQRCRYQPVTFTLLARVLDEAFDADPLSFDQGWLTYTKPPNLSDEYMERARLEDDFGYLRGMLLFQISDLHRMAEAGTIDHPYRYFGIQSPTGHTWYNFDPSAFLECATTPVIDESQIVECGWVDLAVLLWVGQIYE